MSRANLRGSRFRAWETRRKKYGPKGYGAGAYHVRAVPLARSTIAAAIDEIAMARKQCQILLYQSDFKSKAAHRAIDRIDNAWRLLETL